LQDPAKTYPRALSYALIMVTTGYLLPLLVGIGASGADWSDWDDGYFEVVGREVGGRWLGVWIVAAAGISNVGLYCAEMGSDSYQLMGMADRGLLPKFLGVRSKYGTPTAGIIVGSCMCMIFSVFDFNELIEMVNFLYIFAQILEFAAFIKLRVSAPELYRPYRVPLSTRGCDNAVFPGIIHVRYDVAELRADLGGMFPACAPWGCLLLGHGHSEGERVGRIRGVGQGGRFGRCYRRGQGRGRGGGLVGKRWWGIKGCR